MVRISFLSPSYFNSAEFVLILQNEKNSKFCLKHDDHLPANKCKPFERGLTVDRENRFTNTPNRAEAVHHVAGRSMTRTVWYCFVVQPTYSLRFPKLCGRTAPSVLEDWQLRKAPCARAVTTQHNICTALKSFVFFSFYFFVLFFLHRLALVVY